MKTNIPDPSVGPSKCVIQSKVETSELSTNEPDRDHMLSMASFSHSKPFKETNETVVSLIKSDCAWGLSDYMPHEVFPGPDSHAAGPKAHKESGAPPPPLMLPCCNVFKIS